MTLYIKLKNENKSRFAECIALQFRFDSNTVDALYPGRNGEFESYSFNAIDMISVDFQLVYQNGEFSPKWKME